MQSTRAGSSNSIPIACGVTLRCDTAVQACPSCVLSLQELIGKAQVVILHGHQLAANHHYALNLICQQCNELRHLGDLLAERVRSKQAHLQKTLELHTRLQQVEFWAQLGSSSLGLASLLSREQLEFGFVQQLMGGRSSTALPELGRGMLVLSGQQKELGISMSTKLRAAPARAFMLHPCIN